MMIISQNPALGFGYKDTTRRLDINYSGGGLVSIKKEAKDELIGLKLEEDFVESSAFSTIAGIGGGGGGHFHLDTYLNGDVGALAETFDVDLFDTLPTPIEEFKSFDEMNQQRQFSNNYSVNNGQMSMFQDLSSYVSRSSQQQQHSSMEMDDSLATPVVDANSSLMSNGPFFTIPQTPSDMAVNSFNELPSGFSLPSTLASPATVAAAATVPQSTTTAAITAPSSVVASTHFTTPTSQLDYATSVLSPYQRSTPSVESTTSTITSSITPCTTPSLTPCATPSTSVTPSSSSSSLTYAELKPRIEAAFDLTQSDVPTVVNDHPYCNTPGSSFDSKDFTFRSFDESRFRSSSTSSHTDVRRKNNEASKKSRLTKKQKYEEMVREQERLEKENHEKKEQLKELEAITAHLKQYLFNLLGNRRPSCGQGEASGSGAGSSSSSTR